MVSGFCVLFLNYKLYITQCTVSAICKGVALWHQAHCHCRAAITPLGLQSSSSRTAEAVPAERWLPSLTPPHPVAGDPFLLPVATILTTLGIQISGVTQYLISVSGLFHLA